MSIKIWLSTFFALVTFVPSLYFAWKAEKEGSQGFGILAFGLLVAALCFMGNALNE